MTDDNANDDPDNTNSAENTDSTAEPIETAVEQVEALADSLGDAALDGLSEAGEDADDLAEVIAEAAELVSRVDVAAAAGALERPDLSELEALGDLESALEERDPTEAIDATAVPSLVDLDELEDNVDLRAAWRELRELQAALADLSEDDENDEYGEAGMDADLSTPDAQDVDQESLQLAAQSKVSDAVKAFRSEILDAHDRLAASLEDVESRSVDDPDSRNPTAVSTLPSSRGDIGARTRFSTVPRETRYSTAPNFRRIYGSRFESATGDDDE